MATEQEAISIPPVASVEVEDGIDRRQLRALVLVQLRQGLRPGLDAATGGKGSPLKQLIFGLGVMGLFFCLNASYCADLESYLVILFLATFVYVALGVMPDTNDARQRNIDLLHSKPVSEKTLLAARLAVLFAYSSLTATGFAIIPLIAARAVFDCPIALLAGSYLMLIAGSFSIVGLWMALVLAVSFRFQIDRVRMACQVMGLVISLAMAFVCMGFIAAGGRISLASMPAARALPSSWFATFLIDGFDLNANLARAGVLLTLFAAARVMMSSSLGRRYPLLLENMNSPTEQRERPSLSVRLLVKLRSLPLAGRLLVGGQSFGVALLILTAIHREEASRVRLLAPRLLLLFFFAAALVTKDFYFLSFMLSYTGFMALIEGVDLVKRSPSAAASWVLCALPVSGREMLRGMRLAVWVKCYSLPAYLMLICHFVVHPPALALALTAFNFILAGIVISLLVWVAPATPLSREPSLSLSFLGYLLAVAPGVASGLGSFTLTLLFSLSPAISLTFAVFLLTAAMVASRSLSRLAASRLSALSPQS